jgi:hypothetical protein
VLTPDAHGQICSFSGSWYCASERSLATCCKRDGRRARMFVRCARSQGRQLAFRSPIASLGNLPLRDQDPAAHQPTTLSTVHKSRWIAGAASLNGDIPEHSSQAARLNQKGYWLINAILTLYAVFLRNTAYRRRLNSTLRYQSVPRTHQH